MVPICNMVQYLSLLLRKRLYGALAKPAAITAGVVPATGYCYRESDSKRFIITGCQVSSSHV